MSFLSNISFAVNRVKRQVSVNSTKPHVRQPNTHTISAHFPNPTDNFSVRDYPKSIPKQPPIAKAFINAIGRIVPNRKPLERLK